MRRHAFSRLCKQRPPREATCGRQVSGRHPWLISCKTPTQIRLSPPISLKSVFVSPASTGVLIGALLGCWKSGRFVSVLRPMLSLRSSRQRWVLPISIPSLRPSSAFWKSNVSKVWMQMFWPFASLPTSPSHAPAHQALASWKVPSRKHGSQALLR